MNGCCAMAGGSSGGGGLNFYTIFSFSICWVNLDGQPAPVLRADPSKYMLVACVQTDLNARNPRVRRHVLSGLSRLGARARLVSGCQTFAMSGQQARSTAR